MCEKNSRMHEQRKINQYGGKADELNEKRGRACFDFYFRNNRRRGFFWGQN